MKVRLYANSLHVTKFYLDIGTIPIESVPHSLYLKLGFLIQNDFELKGISIYDDDVIYVKL